MNLHKSKHLFLADFVEDVQKRQKYPVQVRGSDFKRRLLKMLAHSRWIGEGERSNGDVDNYHAGLEVCLIERF